MLMTCSGCTAVHPDDLPRCPHCSLETAMPKIHNDDRGVSYPPEPQLPEEPQLPSLPDDEPADEETQDVSTPDVRSPKRPANTASKTAWADYAKARGHDAELVDSLTKPELIDLTRQQATDGEDA